MKMDPAMVNNGKATLEDSLRRTEFFVEATTFEQLMLWSENQNKRDCYWQQVDVGWSETIGEIAKRPICVHFTFAVIDGHLVCFYNPTSEVVDHVKVKKWFVDNSYQPKWDGDRLAFTNAMNFQHCIRHVKESS